MCVCVCVCVCAYVHIVCMFLYVSVCVREAHVVLWIPSQEIDKATRVQIQDDVVCI